MGAVNSYASMAGQNKYAQERDYFGLLDKPCILKKLHVCGNLSYYAPDYLDCSLEYARILSIHEVPYFYWFQQDLEPSTDDEIAISIDGGDDCNCCYIGLAIFKTAVDMNNERVYESEINRKMREFIIGYKPYATYRQVIDFFVQLIGGRKFYLSRTEYKVKKLDKYYNEEIGDKTKYNIELVGYKARL